MEKIKTRTAIPLYGLHILLLLFVFLPLVFAFSSSFRPMEDIYRYVSPLSWRTFIPEHFTLEAYITIFTEHGYGQALLNSLGIALVTVAVGIVFNGMAGFAFAKFQFPCKRLLFLLVVQSLFFTLMFMILPNRRNRFWESLPGGLLASVGWLLFSNLYSVYVTHFPSYANIYGSVYAIAISMLWLYCCLEIIFFGGALNQLLARYSAFTKNNPK